MYLERVGWRTLICGAICLLVASLFYSRAPAQEAPRPELSRQPGRYQIVMHPTFRADQYLLDTVTGQVWQLVTFSSLQGEPVAWRFMTRLDNQADMSAFVLSRQSKGAEAGPPRPKPPAAPPKLN